MEITYTMQGDYLLPNLTLPEQDSRTIGLWGQQHLRYIKRNRPILYTNLLTKCKLNEYLTDVDEQAQKMYDVKTEIFHTMPTAQIFPGVKDIMQKIKNAGMQVGVVTGSGQRPLILRLLDDFGDFLDESHIVTAYDVKRGKPNPDPYLMGLQKAGNLKPWQGIVVENAPLGVRAGVAANIFTVAINSGPLPDEELSHQGCNLLYHKMTEFCNDFESLISIL